MGVHLYLQQGMQETSAFRNCCSYSVDFRWPEPLEPNQVLGVGDGQILRPNFILVYVLNVDFP